MIVISCSTAQKQKSPVHHYFVFSNENMIDYNILGVGMKQNVVMAEQIRTVDKTRLRKFLGTMTPKFMEKIQEIIDISLNLSRDKKEVANEDALEYDTNLNLNMVQTQLLRLVDAKKLLDILCENISKLEGNISKKDIHRLIVTRVKERFKLKKSPVIDFISLVNIFLIGNKKCKMKSCNQNNLSFFLDFP